MKLLNTTLITGVAFATMLVSCKPIYKCGDPMPEKMKGGKRLKAVTMERDSLCSALSAEKTTNAQLSSENGTLRNRLSGQENINDMQAGQLDANARDLRNKEMMLKQLQDIIARQDAAAKKLNSILRDALTGFNSDELTMEMRDGKVYVSMSDKLLFKSASTTVEPKGVDALKVLADVLNKNPDIQIEVEGHTDNVPIKTATFKDNWDLSVERATSITRLLTEKYGVSSTRVTASGRGEYMPKADNGTPEGRAKNRRTEIILSPKLDEIMNLLNGSTGSNNNGGMNNSNDMNKSNGMNGGGTTGTNGNMNNSNGMNGGTTGTKGTNTNSGSGNMNSNGGTTGTGNMNGSGSNMNNTNGTKGTNTNTGSGTMNNSNGAPANNSTAPANRKP